MSISDILSSLEPFRNTTNTSRFFKAIYPDQFAGIPTPIVKKIAKEHQKNFPFDHFIQSRFNEERLLALWVLCLNYKKAPEETFETYIHHLSYVNNWNLVDTSAHVIVGAYAFSHNASSIILELAHETDLWKQRIAIVATWYFIRKQSFTLTFEIAEKFLSSTEDLIHKATGWMLREIIKYGGVNQLRTFLKKHSHTMPRTMLRYAIEKFSPEERAMWMSFKDRDTEFLHKFAQA